jgi:hypothetical protein
MLGAACATADQCQSGQCVDGVCCASASTMACHACDGQGTAGQCLPVPEGGDPDDECAPEPAMTCGRDGTCDGKGACRRYPAGTQCVPGSCTGATEQGARSCDGNGTCMPGSSRSCAPNVCMGASCGTRCTDASQCQPGFFCSGGTCQVKRPTGQACAAPAECASGQCIDGVCCSTACGMPCFACNLPGAAGTCTAVPGGQDPGNDCPSDPAAGCQRDGTCNGRGGCRLHAATVECAPAACAGGSATPARLCNGLGACPAAAPADCAPFVCGATACKTSCMADADCRAGLQCREGRCLPSGLVLYWKFDETEGNVAEDASGNNLQGTYAGVTGTPAPSTSVPLTRFPNPSSRAFLGASRVGVVLPMAPMLLKPVRELTIAAFYRATQLDDGGSGPPTASEVVSLGDNYLLRVRNTDIEVSKRIGSSNGGWVRCFGVLTGHLDGMWHHIATVIDGVTVKVYFDGDEKCTVNNAADMVYDNGPDFWVGRHGQNKPEFDFDGNIDEVRVYSRALSRAEIAALAAGQP